MALSYRSGGPWGHGGLGYGGLVQGALIQAGLAQAIWGVRVAVKQAYVRILTWFTSF